MPGDKVTKADLDRQFQKGRHAARSAQLDRRLNAARMEWERKHPGGDKIVEEANRHRPHPFLVIPAMVSDHGARPIKPINAVHNASIRVVALDVSGKPTGGPVAIVKAGQHYQIECVVANLGNAPALMGIAEFYAATAADFDTAAAHPDAKLPPLGYNGFTALEGKSVTVHCKKAWSPTASQATHASVLVQVYDITTDFISNRFDAIHDRHVGRMDFTPAPDFTSKWAGPYEGPVGKEPQLAMNIHQTGNDLTADIKFDLQNVPAQKATGKISGQQAILHSKGSLGQGLPQADSTWTLTFQNASTLHVQHDITDTTNGKKLSGQGALNRV